MRVGVDATPRRFTYFELLFNQKANVILVTQGVDGTRFYSSGSVGNVRVLFNDSKNYGSFLFDTCLLINLDPRLKDNNVQLYY